MFSLLQYVVCRNTQHHLAEGPPWGWMVPIVALLPLFAHRTRAHAVLLWSTLLSWLAVVALNGQARWQNERYTMPAVAWLLVLFAMGLGLVLSPSFPQRVAARLKFREPFGMLARVALTATALGVYWAHQMPQMKDHLVFRARQSEHPGAAFSMAGAMVRESGARRVLVGDAGAITFISGPPWASILIGLGGFHYLPFARAGLYGLGCIPRAD